VTSATGSTENIALVESSTAASAGSLLDSMAGPGAEATFTTGADVDVALIEIWLALADVTSGSTADAAGAFGGLVDLPTLFEDDATSSFPTSPSRATVLVLTVLPFLLPDFAAADVSNFVAGRADAGASFQPCTSEAHTAHVASCSFLFGKHLAMAPQWL